MTYPVRYGGDSGNRIFVLYWRCPLIRVSVIRGSTVFKLIFERLDGGAWTESMWLRIGTGDELL